MKLGEQQGLGQNIKNTQAWREFEKKKEKKKKNRGNKNNILH